MALREILVSLGFDFDKNQEKQLFSTIGAIKKAAIGLGIAFGAKQIADFVSSTVAGVAQAGDELDELSQKLGVSAQALQELAPIAEKNGASMGDLAVGLRTLSRNAVEASKGSKEMRAGFSQLGVSVTDSSGKLKSAEQLLTELSDGFAGMTDDISRTALAQRLLGKSGTQLIPTLLKGSKELQRQRQQAHELGLVMSDELLRLSSDYTDAQADQIAVTKGLKQVFARQLLPAFIAGAKALTALLLRAKPLVLVLGQGLATALTATARVLRGLGQAATLVARGIAALGPVLGTLVTITAALTAATALFGSTAIIAWLKATAPLLLFIVLLGIIIAAIVLVIEDLVAMGDGMESVSGAMVEGFQALVEELGSIPAAIGAMLKEAMVFWLDFFGMTRQGAEDMVSSIIQFFVGMFKTLNEGFDTAVKFWANLIQDFFAGLVARFQKVAGFVSGLMGGGAAAGGLTTAAPLVGGGGTSSSTIVNQPRTEVTVSVDASGGAMNPVEIGGAVRREIDAALEARDRQTAQALGVAVPALAGG
jgi:hypothetical protein